LLLWFGIRRTLRKEAFLQDLSDIGARQLALDRTTDYLAAAAEDRYRSSRQLRVAEQRFLRHPATVPEHLHLAGIKLRSFLRERLCGGMSEGQVHVVAAEQDMIADGHTCERQLAVFFTDGDQRKVRGAAANIANQDDVADLDLLAPAIPAGMDPCV